jgi:hypothetical protein
MQRKDVFHAKRKANLAHQEVNVAAIILLALLVITIQLVHTELVIS